MKRSNWICCGAVSNVNTNTTGDNRAMRKINTSPIAAIAALVAFVAITLTLSSAQAQTSTQTLTINVNRESITASDDSGTQYEVFSWTTRRIVVPEPFWSNADTFKGDTGAILWGDINDEQIFKPVAASDNPLDLNTVGLKDRLKEIITHANTATFVLTNDGKTLTINVNGESITASDDSGTQYEVFSWTTRRIVVPEPFWSNADTFKGDTGAILWGDINDEQIFKPVAASDNPLDLNTVGLKDRLKEIITHANTATFVLTNQVDDLPPPPDFEVAFINISENLCGNGPYTATVVNLTIAENRQRPIDLPYDLFIVIEGSEYPLTFSDEHVAGMSANINLERGVNNVMYEIIKRPTIGNDEVIFTGAFTIEATSTGPCRVYAPLIVR